jgi:PAS domain S-box-containing protein
MSIAIATPTPERRMAEIGRELHIPLIAALAYYLGAEAAFVVGTLSDKIFAPFWPPNIVLLCALARSPYRRWWLVILAVFPAHVIAEIGIGMSAPQLMVAFASNCMVAIISAAALRHWRREARWFGSLRDTCLYLAVATVASPAVSALVGAFVPALSAGSAGRFWSFWAQWYLSNAVGSVVLGPIALVLLDEARRRPLQAPRRSAIEAAAVAASLIIVCSLAFEAGSAIVPASFLPAAIYLPLPVVLWAAVRFGVKGASGAVLLVSVILVWRALNGPSLFLAGDPETSVLALQVFILGLAIPVLLLAASIDETRHAEKLARESEERMAIAAISADVCLWHIDYYSKRFWVTDHGRDILGFRPGEIISRHAVMSAIHPDDRQQAVETMRAAAVEKRLADCEFRIVRPDNGEIRWIRCRARAHGDYRGALAEIGGTFADITERRSAETELAQQRSELAHLMRVSMLGELSAGIAHELTQPLSAILSNAEAAKVLLTQHPPDVAEAVEALDDIVGEDNRAAEVIHRLRRLLRKSEVKFEPTDVNDIVNATLRVLHTELATRGISVSTSLTANVPLVSGDAIQLQQVLLNLLLNAADAMNEVVPPRRIIEIETEVTSIQDVQIVVSDCGLGLAPDHQERVFQPFFTTKARGLGLGLSLCSAIAKLHGGSLTLENGADGGATATLTLPALQRLEATG